MTAALVTICSVLTPVHRRLFQRNYDLTRELNRGTSIRWEVVENVGIPLDHAVWKALVTKHGPTKTTKRYERYCASLSDGQEEIKSTADRTVRAGVTIDEVAAMLRWRHRDEPDIDDRVERLVVTVDGRSQKLAGSYHHAFGLSRAVAAATGRFVVLLDPDFYVVRRNWIADVVNHMLETGIAIFGAPWHPFWFNKFRGFPCTHFMVIDRSRVDIDPDDVVPDLLHDQRLPNDPVLREWAGADGGPPPGRWRRVWTLPALLAADRRQRRLIGGSRDTGFLLNARHAHRRMHECVTPVIGSMSARDLKPPVVSALQLHLDRLYARPRRYWQADAALGARAGFAEHGLPAVRPAGWEEFLWRDVPFAFHVRGHLLRVEGARVDQTLIDRVLGRVTDAVVSPPPVSLRSRRNGAFIETALAGGRAHDRRA